VQLVILLKSALGMSYLAKPPAIFAGPVGQ
jgi:hypothetical protein